MSNRLQEMIDLRAAAEVRTAQLSGLAIVLHDSLDAGSIDKKALQNTVWLMADMLKAQHRAITKLQKLHCTQ